MINRLITLIVIIFLSILSTFGQEGEDNGSFLIVPDTFEFYKVAETKYFSTLSSIKGRVFDSISKPKAYFIDTRSPGDGLGYMWCIAVKRDNNYVVFNPFEKSNAYTQTSNLVFSRKDFNGRGNQELIIEWQFYRGHSGWENSVHERMGGIQIWDLDNLTRLMDFDNLYNLESWWSSYAPDSTDTLDYSQREVVNSGSEYQYEKYDVKVEKKIITIQKENHLKEESISDTSKSGLVDNEIHTYRLTNKGIVLKKK